MLQRDLIEKDLEESVETESKNFMKFGRNTRICFGRRDMWIEEYKETEFVNKKTKEKETRKNWVVVTGYFGKVKQLLESYGDEMFLRGKGNLDEYREIAIDIKDAIDRLPDYFISTFHKIPIIIQKEIIYIDKTQEKEIKRKQIEDQYLAKVVKPEKKKIKKEKVKKEKEIFVESNGLF